MLRIILVLMVFAIPLRKGGIKAQLYLESVRTEYGKSLHYI